ncbi:MAG TPA: hypothetical protein VK524_24895, partial [Polyangiaceae bacterium]|nr:hypothetical protein [Polyangiaceae bacterium]
PVYRYEKTGISQALAVSAWNFDRLKVQGRYHIPAGLWNRVWFLENVGYLMDALGNTSVVRSPPPETTAGEIQLQGSANETLTFNVQMLADFEWDTAGLTQPPSGLGRALAPLPVDRDKPAVWQQLDWMNTKVVLYRPDGSADSRAFPLFGLHNSLALPENVDFARRTASWFTTGGWVESFSISPANGIYRVRLETPGRPVFRMRLLDSSNGKSMVSSASGDGVSAGDRYPLDLPRWFHVPSGTPSVKITYFRERTFNANHIFKLQVTKPNGEKLLSPDPYDIGLRPSTSFDDHSGRCETLPFPNDTQCKPHQVITRATPDQTNQMWRFDLGPAYALEGPHRLDFSSSREKRLLYLEGIPRFSAASSTSGFVPSALWAVRGLGTTSDAAPSYAGAMNATLAWQAIAGADDYKISVKSGFCYDILVEEFPRERARGNAIACTQDSECAFGPCFENFCAEEDHACAYGAGTCKRRMALPAGLIKWWIRPFADFAGGVAAGPVSAASPEITMPGLGDIASTSDVVPVGGLPQFQWQGATAAVHYAIEIDDGAPGTPRLSRSRSFARRVPARSS